MLSFVSLLAADVEGWDVCIEPSRGKDVATKKDWRGNMVYDRGVPLVMVLN